MDIIEDFAIIDEIEDAVAHYRAAMRRTRVLRDRINFLEVLNDVDFRSRFRLPKNAVNVIHDQIKHKIRTTRNGSAPTIVRLLLTLRYFATGSYLISAGDFVGVSRSSACHYIEECSDAIARLRPKYICFPQDLASLKEGFYNLARFPRVIGAIDCMHVAISRSEEIFRNSNGVLSLKVQIICDADLIIRNIVARWPGSTDNQTVFDNSVIMARFEAGHFKNSVLLGDGCYQSKPYIFTPLEKTNTPAENLYNESQIRSRHVIERCFRFLNSRFPVLQRRRMLSGECTEAIVVSCAVLHNVAVSMHDKPFQLEREPDTIEEQIFHNDDPRRDLILNYFTPLLNNYVALNN